MIDPPKPSPQPDKGQPAPPCDVCRGTGFDLDPVTGARTPPTVGSEGNASACDACEGTGIAPARVSPGLAAGSLDPNPPDPHRGGK